MFTKKIEKNQIKYFSEKKLSFLTKFLIYFFISLFFLERVGGFLSKLFESIFSFMGKTGLIIGGSLGFILFFVGIYFIIKLTTKIINKKEDLIIIDGEGILINNNIVKFDDISAINKVTVTNNKTGIPKMYYIELSAKNVEYDIIRSQDQFLVADYIDELNSLKNK